MIEVLWHGRGGQGAFTAARLLGAAASLAEGSFSLAFPSFGPERRGAPMKAFTKIDDVAIGDRSAFSRADWVVYLDETLFDDSWTTQLKPGGKVLINSVHSFDDARIIAIDANGIARRILGRAIPNTVFLGALSLLIESLTYEDVCRAVRAYMPARLHEKNIAVIDAVREMYVPETNSFSSAPAADGEQTSRGLSAKLDEDSLPKSHPMYPPRRSIAVPRLQSLTVDAADYARFTSYRAGHLVKRNAGWRKVRPIVDEGKCTGCRQCYLHCPDGAIYMVNVAAAREKAAFDLDFCKGCGLCVSCCNFGALRMIDEQFACSLPQSGFNGGNEGSTSEEVSVL